MKFKSYQHIEQLGRPAVEGILNGQVYIFDKLDGANVSIYLNDAGEIEVASRTRPLSEVEDMRGVVNYVRANEKFQNFFAEYPELRLFGEWLVPHTLRNYEESAWKKIYIFDVMDKDNKYLRYDKYFPMLQNFEIEYVPAIAILFKPAEELVRRYLDDVTFLISDALGEGIVIKNYDFVNQFGETVWAKIVNPLPKAAIKLKRPVDGANIETEIIETFLTPELVEKEFAKIVNDNDGKWDRKLIEKLLGCVWYAFITEETFNFIKKFKSPKVDFRILNNLAVDKIKDLKSDLFK